VVNAAVSRQVTAADFGRFSVLYLLLYFGMAFLRAIFGEPLLLVGQIPERTTGTLYGWAVGSSAVCAVVLGFVQGAILVSIFHSAWLLVSIAVLPAIVFQDVLRFVAFSLGQPHVAAASDLAVLLPLPILIIWHPHALPVEELAIAFWAASSILSAAFAARWLLKSAATVHVRRYWNLSRRPAVGSITEFGATAMVSIVPVTLIPLGSSLSDTAAVRVLQMMFSPITVVHAAAFSLIAPRIAQRRHSSSHGMSRLLYGYAFALAGCSVALTAVLVAIPRLGASLFPSSYADARSFLTTYLLVQLVGVGVGTVTLGLRATDSYDGVARVRILTAAVTPVAAVLAVASGGVRGFCLALAAMQLPVLFRGLQILSRLNSTA
jgi:hypothetical protein